MKRLFSALLPAIASLLLAVSCAKGPASVTVTPSEIEITEGQSYVLTASVQPSDAKYDGITWTSSNTSVAMVQEGTVRGLKPGTAVITAKAGGVSGNATVTVIASEVPASGITINPDTIELTEGGTSQLTATVWPMEASQEVEWSSLDKGVATVDDNGLVTAVKAGSTRIYARSKAYPDKRAQCEVTVTEDTSLKGISFGVSEMELTVGQKRTITVIFTPTYAANKNVAWRSSDAGIATVNDGIVEALKEGEATITATSEEGGFKASCRVIVSKSSGAKLYANYNGYAIFVNGEPDPMTGKYDDDYKSCAGNNSIDSDGSHLYSIESYHHRKSGEYHWWICTDRKPIKDINDAFNGSDCNDQLFSFSSLNGTAAVAFKSHSDYDKHLLVVRPDNSLQDYNLNSLASSVNEPNVAVAPDGTVYCVSSIVDSFGDYQAVLYTVGADGILHETILTKSVWSGPVIDIAEGGDVYCLCAGYDKDNNEKYMLFKNGELLSELDALPWDTYGEPVNCALSISGGHVYTVVGTDVYSDGKLHVRKDGELLFTMDLGSDMFLHGGKSMAVSASGDVYIEVIKGDGTACIYKNGQPLYTAPEPYCYWTQICIVE